MTARAGLIAAAIAQVSPIAMHIAPTASQGRWDANSPIVLGYIRAVDKWRHKPMKGIGL